MAKIITLKLLLDSSDAEKMIIELGSREKPEMILDYLVSEVKETCEELNDSVVNETMEPGDAFRPWVIFSASEYKLSDGEAGYWSNIYGWGTIDLATKFDGAAKINVPMSAGMDSTMIIYR